MPRRLTKKIDSLVLQALLSAKLVEQLNWKQLPERYEELTGEGIDWRTLHRHLLEELGAALLPVRATTHLKDVIEEAYRDANALTLGLRVLVARYQQFSVFHERYLRSLATTAADRKDLGETLPDPLTKEEVGRMDKLAQDITDFLFKGIVAMKEGSGTMADLLQRAFGAGAVAAAGTLVGVDENEGESTLGLVDSVGRESVKMLQEMNARHRKEGMGHWRPQKEEATGEDE